MTFRVFKPAFILRAETAANAANAVSASMAVCDDSCSDCLYICYFSSHSEVGSSFDYGIPGGHSFNTDSFLGGSTRYFLVPDIHDIFIADTAAFLFPGCYRHHMGGLCNSHCNFFS